jgi:hypothetical protein
MLMAKIMLVRIGSARLRLISCDARHCNQCGSISNPYPGNSWSASTIPVQERMLNQLEMMGSRPSGSTGDHRCTRTINFLQEGSHDNLKESEISVKYL